MARPLTSVLAPHPHRVPCTSCEAVHAHMEGIVSIFTCLRRRRHVPPPLWHSQHRRSDNISATPALWHGHGRTAGKDHASVADAAETCPPSPALLSACPPPFPAYRTLIVPLLFASIDQLAGAGHLPSPVEPTPPSSPARRVAPRQARAARENMASSSSTEESRPRCPRHLTSAPERGRPQQTWR